MGSIWGGQDPGGPYVGPMNVAIWGNSANVHDKFQSRLTI